MNLWLRVLWLLLSAPFKPRIDAPLGVSRLRFRVLPNDIDTNLHLNNGRYLTIADLGRTDLLIRGGLLKVILRDGLAPMLSGSAVRYRKELGLLQAFTLESRVVCWRDTIFVMEHRYVTRGRDGAPVTSAIALVRGGLYDRKGRRFVPASRLAELVGYSGPSPEFTQDIEDFLAVEAGLKAR